MKQSELFDHLVYLSEVCDVLAIAMAELPNLLSPPEVAEALLRLKYGPYIICHIVANQPDCFSEGNFAFDKPLRHNNPAPVRKFSNFQSINNPSRFHFSF